MEERERGSLIQHPSCPYCKDAVQPADEKIACHGCMAWHHADCWTSHGVCSACGVAQGDGAVSALEQRATRSRCAWPDCALDATETPEGESGDRVLVAGERLHVDRLCNQHTRAGLGKQARGQLAALWLLLLLSVAFPFLMVAAGRADRGSADPAEVFMQSAVMIAIVGVGGLTLFARRARALRIIEACKDEPS